MTCINPTPVPPRRPRRRGALTAARALAAAVLIGPIAALAQSGPQPRLPTVDLQAGLHIIKAEVALTHEQQATGMMFRTEMGTNEGMLFVNEDLGVRCFWMRNTLIPLAIAFIADDGTIVNIAEMEARSDRSHCSEKPVRFALEMNKGWFAKRGLKAGARLSGPPFRK